MRKLLLLTTLLIGSLGSSFGQCPAPEIAPWTEPFTTTVDPPCWTQSATTGGPWVYTGTPDLGTTATIVDHTSGVANNYAWVDQSATDAGVILQSPVIDVSALTTPALSMWVLSHNNNGTVSVFNEIHVEASDGAGGWNPVEVISGDFGFQWVEFVFNLSSYTYGANLVQLRFRAESGGDGSDFDNDMLLDDVSVIEGLTTCWTPTLITASNVDWQSADLSWTETGTATTWNIEYGPSGFTPGTGTMITGTTNNPETITGLSPQTTYDFYVQADCGGGDLSAWTLPSTFTTPCSPVVAPWLDDVETMTPSTSFTDENCWTSTGSGYDWNIDGAGSTPSTGTGPAGAYSGTNYFYVEASSGTAGVSVAELYSPLIDVSALTEPMIEFYYHMYGAVTGDLYVDAWDGSTWNQVDLISGQQQTAQADPWLRRAIALTGYTGVTQIRFRAISGGTLEGDISLDDIAMIEAPSCLAPSNLTATNVTSSSADLGWQENGTATTWNVEYGPAGFTPGTGTMITGTTNNPESVTGLTAQTGYEFYVQADCGGGNLSTWSGPWSFTTPCAPVVAPWTDDVESMTATTSLTSQNCWTTTGSGYDWNIDGAGSTPSTGTGPSGAYSGVNYFYVEASSGTAGTSVTELYSPMVDISALSLPMVEFYYHMFGGDMGDLFVDAWDGSTWNQVGLISGQQQTAQTDPWLRKVIYLTGYTGVTQIRFRAVSAGTYEGDISLDNISILEAPSCPEPSDFIVLNSDNSSVDLGWTVGPTGETEWQLEFGSVGFVPETGVGTTILTTNNPETISGLTPNTFYEVYLQGVCGASDTSALVGPLTFNTYNQGQFMDWNTDCPTGGFIDISATGTDLNLTDDSEAAISPLPFPVLYQGILMNDVTVGNNGGIQLGSTTANIGYGGNFTTLADGYIFPWGDDLDDETGNVYYETIGTAPNRTFIIQWDNSCNWPGGATEPTVTFQIQIDEATQEIYFVYDDVIFGGTDVADDYGANADIGLAGPNQDITVSTNDQQYLMDNSCARFYYTDCPNPVNYSVIYTTTDEAGISWSAGLAGETDWTVIYGPAGFDPLTQGTTINVTSPSAILPGLNDVTTYDVYIYADCNPGTLQSTGFMGQFTTLPNCSDVTGLTTATAVDSLFTSWSWTESSGVGTYASTGFNLQYGNAGFNLYSGTVVNADNNYTDTTFDASFLSGGVYEVYVQAVCGTDTSNYVGPITFIMPLENDSTCLAENLNVDGTVYVFNNTGATTQLNETNIAPPATGCSTTDGWCNSNINFTTWFTFQAPPSGNMLISAADVGFDGQVAIYDVTSCSNLNSFTLLGANDDAIGGGSAAPEFSICGLTPGNTYYLMHDSYSTVTTGNYSLRLEEIVVEAGTTSGIIDVCTGATVDLFNGITGYDAGGTWTEEIPTAGFSGSTFNSAGLAYQIFNFEYTMVDGCATDSVIQQVQIYGPSSAGQDGTITVCKNEPFDLLAGLSGNVDLGGTWYDPSNNPLASSSIVASSIAGQFNYDYIASNGVCPNDTSNVVVNVDPGCDYLNISELYFSDVTIYPNPASDVIFIANGGSTEIFSYEVTDAQGKVIATKEGAINGTEITEINVKNLETGLYLIRVYNDNAEKTFRIVKQ